MHACELLELLAERLPPRMVVIILLMDVFDFTAKETAELISSKETTVQVTLGRARTRLRRMANRFSVEEQLKHS
jgi:RNA polymerase sigma-70 factor (ECF subfamily)